MRTALSRHIAALRRHIGMALFGAALLLGLGSIATAPAATTAAAGCEEDPYCHNMPADCASGCCGNECNSASQICCLPPVRPGTD
jgi:hypothetical protein